MKCRLCRYEFLNLELEFYQDFADMPAIVLFKIFIRNC